MTTTLFILQGLERDRIKGAVSKIHPDKVFIIRNDPERYEMPEIEDIIKDLIEKAIEDIKRDRGIPTPSLIDYKTYKIPFFDFFESYVKLSRIIEAHITADEDVYLDITGGTRIAASALFLVGLVHRVKTIYVSPENYNVPEKDPQMGIGIRDVKQIPSLPITVDEKKIDMDILRALDELGGKADSISDIIKKIKKRVAVISQSDRIVVSRKLTELNSLGLIKIIPGKGRTKKVKLTNHGHKWLKLDEELEGY
jgi:hypothetical protein